MFAFKQMIVGAMAIVVLSAAGRKVVNAQDLAASDIQSFIKSSGNWQGSFVNVGVPHVRGVITNVGNVHSPAGRRAKMYAYYPAVNGKPRNMGRWRLIFDKALPIINPGGQYLPAARIPANTSWTASKFYLQITPADANRSNDSFVKSISQTVTPG